MITFILIFHDLIVIKVIAVLSSITGPGAPALQLDQSSLFDNLDVAIVLVVKNYIAINVPVKDSVHTIPLLVLCSQRIVWNVSIIKCEKYLLTTEIVSASLTP